VCPMLQSSTPSDLPIDAKLALLQGQGRYAWPASHRSSGRKTDTAAPIQRLRHPEDSRRARHRHQRRAARCRWLLTNPDRNPAARNDGIMGSRFHRNAHGARGEAGVFGIWLCAAKCVADGLRILRGEQYPHDLAAIFVMLKNFLTDQLTLAVAIGASHTRLAVRNASQMALSLAALLPPSAGRVP
jgi:hypothetical protein